MTQTVYEGLFVLDYDLYMKDAETVSGQITVVVEQLGGEILHSKKWDERELAYPIKGHRQAVYWLAYFRLDSEKVTELSQQFQLSDSVLRFLFLNVDPRLVDILVEHAKSGLLHTGEPSVDKVVNDIFDQAAEDAENDV